MASGASEWSTAFVTSSDTSKPSVIDTGAAMAASALNVRSAARASDGAWGRARDSGATPACHADVPASLVAVSMGGCTPEKSIEIMLRLPTSTDQGGVTGFSPIQAIALMTQA